MQWQEPHDRETGAGRVVMKKTRKKREKRMQKRPSSITWKVGWGEVGRKRGLLTLTILLRELKLRKSQCIYLANLTSLACSSIKYLSKKSKLGVYIQEKEKNKKQPQHTFRMTYTIIQLMDQGMEE